MSLLNKQSYQKLKQEDEKLNIDDVDRNSNFVSAESDNNHGNNTPAKLSRRQIIGLALFIGVSLLVIITISIALVQNRAATSERKSRSERKFSLVDVLSGKYGYDSYTTDWISDTKYLHNSGGVLKQYDMTQREDTKDFITSNEAYEMKMQRVKELSPDRDWFLFANNTKGLYRHSFYGDYYVKNMKTKKVLRIELKEIDGDQNEQIRYCGWSSVNNALVFVYKCNIYYIPTVDTTELKYYKITHDGIKKKVFNGVPDWVYEEEIIASTHAIEFSSDGKHMSYVNFNATSVPFYKFPKYNDPSNQYTVIENIAYPKAGYPNPTINIHVVNLADIESGINTTRQKLEPPAEMSKGDFYYAVMKWNKEKKVFIQWMNRHQNNTINVLYNVVDKTSAVMEQHTTPKGWIDDDYVKPYFSADGSYYITMLPKEIPGMGDFRHLAKVTIGDDKGTIEYLTDGPFTVQDINCHNPDEEVMYFRSTEGSTRFRQVYKLDIKTKIRTCFSCGKIQDNGVNCTYHYPQFSSKCSWVALMCQGPFVPKTHMLSTKTDDQFALTGNSNTKELLAEKDLPTVHYYEVESDGLQIPVRETRPLNFDPNRKYAVLFDVYGGPNTQKVTDKFQISFDHYFVTTHDIILVTCDARGTGYKGYDFLYAIYRKLGYYESIDAINVAKYLQKQSYVDPNRIAIWGWSYGGFYSATIMGMENTPFKTAVAVAPVTDWRYYDTVYTERYMGLPTAEDNLEGYQSTSVMSKAKNFAGKNFLLIHGTADDNVHFQNSAQLAAALIREKVKFRSQFFTDRDHGIESGGYVYILIADFLVAHLKGTNIAYNLTPNIDVDV